MDLTYEIGDKVSSIFETTLDEHAENLEEVALEIEKVTGVQRVDILSSRKTIAVMQRDSVWLNFFLDSDAFYEKGNETDGTPAVESNVQRAKNKKVGANDNNLPEESKFVLDGKRALVLQPFYTDGGCHRLVNHAYLLGTSLLGTLTHSTLFDVGDAGGNADDHAPRRRHEGSSRLLG